MEYLRKQPFASGNRIIVKFCSKVKPIQSKDQLIQKISEKKKKKRDCLKSNFIKVTFLVYRFESNQLNKSESPRLGF